MSPQSQEEIEQARNILRDLYGSSLEEKASDAFCLTFSRSSASSSAIRPESFLEPTTVSAPTPIIELTSDSELSIEEQTSLTTNQIIRNIAELDISTPERLRIYTALRQVRVAAKRERFFQSASRIIDELESNLASLYTVRSASLENPSSLTQVCWLNHSLRSLNEPSALAEVSADPKIEKIDLPKKLEAELDTTGSTIGAKTIDKIIV